MISIVSVLNNVYKGVFGNQIILRNLYYPSASFSDDPLDAGKADVTPEKAVKYVKKVSGDYLIEQIINDGSDKDESEKRGYVTIFLDDGERFNNPYATDFGIRIEIYMPVRNFEEQQYRIAAIIEQLNIMFQQGKVDGAIGRLVLDNSYNIAQAGDGYVGYSQVYKAGNIVGI